MKKYSTYKWIHIDLKKSSFGVSEPSYGFDITSKLEVVIVPALGMTKDNYRLGLW